MAELKTFAPLELIPEAVESGFFHCRQCGLVWFGRPELSDTCPDCDHGDPVRVVLLCRVCDEAIRLGELKGHVERCSVFSN
jgi:hypothetical protein